MERTFTGWIPKSLSKNIDLKNKLWTHEYGYFPIFTTKGKKIDWSEKDWPPTKVKITVETL